MSGETFEAIAGKAEALARARPHAYRVRLAAMAAAGYGFLLLVLGMLFGLMGWIAWLVIHSGRLNAAEIKIVLVLGVIAFIMLRSLWVKLDPPAGIVLRAAEYPSLFETIEKARVASGSPAPDRVVLNGDFNASIAQVPRLGLFGWYRSQLTLGLPLMECLPPSEFESVLAHEFGHLSGAHGKLGVWIYRVRQTWIQVVQNLAESGSLLTRLLLPFARWYVPRFSAYSLAQMRQHEYAADRCAATVSGPETAASALMRIGILASWVEERFWDSIYKQADRLEHPVAALPVLPAALREFSEVSAASQWLRLSLLQQTEGDDTHPALRDRLAAIHGRPVAVTDEELDQRAAALIKPGVTASTVFLGAKASALATELDAVWCQAIAPRWRERYSEIAQQREHLQRLEAKAASGNLDEKETWARAWMTENLVGEAQALPLYASILAGKPDDFRAQFAMGRLLLSRKDEQGIGLIEAVMNREPEAVVSGCQILIRYHYERGDMERVRELRRRAELAHERDELAAGERNLLMDGDKLMAHDLPEVSVAAIRAIVSETPGVRRAWVVHKKVKTLPEKPCRILVVERKVSFFTFEDSARQAQTVQKLADGLAERVDPLDLGLRVFVVARSSAIIRKAKRIEGALLFRAT